MSWVITRDADGMEIMAARTRRELSPFVDGGQWAGGHNGFLSPDDTVSIAKVVVSRCEGCEGQNEDYSVYCGECDICGFPTR